MFNLSDTIARMGKISNSLEKHGDEEVIAYDVPVTVLIGHEQLDELAGKYTHRALFNTTNRGGKVEDPVEVMSRCKPLELIDNYEDAKAVLELSGGTEYEYQDVRVSKLTLEPMVGGLTSLKFSLRIRPSGAKECFALLEHQNREIHVAVSDGKVALKKSKQQDLPLNSTGDGEEAEDEAEPEKRGRARKNGDRPAAH